MSTSWCVKVAAVGGVPPTNSPTVKPSSPMKENLFFVLSYAPGST